MALRERLIKEPGFVGVGNGNSPDGDGQQTYQEVKSRLHRVLINRMDLSKLSTLTPEQVNAEVSRLAESVLTQAAMPLSCYDRERLPSEVQHGLLGLGPCGNW